MRAFLSSMVRGCLSMLVLSGVLFLSACENPIGKGPSTHQTQEPLTGFLSTNTGLSRDFEYLSDARGFLLGQVSLLRTPSLDAQNTLSFSMDVLTFASTAVTVEVRVPADALRYFFDADGTVSEMTPVAARAVLEDFPLFVQASGNGVTENGVFTADAGIIVYDVSDTYDLEALDATFAVGEVIGPASATISLDGALEFDMLELNLSSAYTGAGYNATLHTVVLPSAQILYYDEEGESRILSVSAAQALLNGYGSSSNGFYIEATSSIAVSVGLDLRTLTVDEELTIYEYTILEFEFEQERFGVPMGEAEMLAGGGLRFMLEDRFGYRGNFEDPTIVEVQPDAKVWIYTATISENEWASEYVETSIGELLDVLNGEYVELYVYGEWDAASQTLRADWVDVERLASGDEWYAGYVFTDAEIDGEGNLSFLSIDINFAKPDAVVHAPAGTPLWIVETNEDGSTELPQAISAQDFVDILNGEHAEYAFDGETFAIGTLDVEAEEFTAEEVFASVYRE